MQLPLSSSLSESEDGVLHQHLKLADSNAELNKCIFYGLEVPYETSSTDLAACARGIYFNPEVSVRFIRPRSNTMRSNLSDVSIASNNRYGESPLGPDSKQQLKESSPQSDDEEFEKFYKTMPQVRIYQGHLSNHPVRRLSLDGDMRGGIEEMPSYYEDDDATSTSTPDENRYSRTRSMSCDEFFFHTNSI